MAQKGRKRHDYMSEDQTVAMRGFKRTHQNCIKQTGVARPGKTAKDRAMRHRGQV